MEDKNELKIYSDYWDKNNESNFKCDTEKPCLNNIFFQ